MAENIRAKRQISIQNQQYGFLSADTKATNFIVYFKEQIAKRNAGNQRNWDSALTHLNNFFGDHIKIADLNEKLCSEFGEYILKAPKAGSEQDNLTTISRNSAYTYFSKFKTVLLQAYKDGLLQTDLSRKINSIRMSETHREFLTLEELQKCSSRQQPQTFRR